MHPVSKIPTAGEIMSPSVFCLTCDMPIEAAIRALLQRGFSGAPVLDEDGRLCGVLSERDCTRVLAEAAFHGMPEGAVKVHMTRDVISVDPETDVFTVISRFEDAAVRRLPVVADGRVIGLIARRDALRALSHLGEARVVHGREPQEIAATRSAV
jgi:CBS domain-containing protein